MKFVPNSYAEILMEDCSGSVRDKVEEELLFTSDVFAKKSHFRAFQFDFEPTAV